jgi:tetratricopeptide (TPR) repeat protein
MVAKLARAVAAVSVSVPVIVIIDDADQLEPDLAVVLVENLIERIDGRVLVVAAVDSSSDLESALTSRATYGLTEGRVRTVDANPDMDYQARVGLTAELCPNLPAAAIRRIGQRTETFAEVFAVASAERLAELDSPGDDAAIVTVVDEVIDAQVNRAPPSTLAVVLAWAGGVMHARQAKRAVEVLGGVGLVDNSDVIRFESLVRLADPASPRLTEQVRVLAPSKRRSMAQVVFDTAHEIGREPRAGLVDKVVAWQAAHRIRADLRDHTQLIDLQCQLVHGLEDLRDTAEAYQVARTALADLYLGGHPGRQDWPERDQLSAAGLRLRQTLQSRHDDPLLDATVSAAAAGGATVGLEARVWAAIELLGQQGQHERALKLTDQITADLSSRNDLGAVGNQWRLLLAFHAGKAGYPAISQRLLNPMITAGTVEQQEAAQAVLYAIGDPHADTRLQIVILEEELAAKPWGWDDLLRLHSALAKAYDTLGYYPNALQHGRDELALRQRLQGPDHRQTLRTRAWVAHWTGECGNSAEALRLYQELLPDEMRFLGHDHENTLTTRDRIACWTGECGNSAEALRLYQELLPDEMRFLGHDHESTLSTRAQIAFWTAKCGDHAEALRMYRDVLPDLVRVLGQDHRKTLITRANIALEVDNRGDSAEALRLYQELLPDEVQILGKDHPDTLATRGNIVRLLGDSGDSAEALRLFKELLADRVRVLGHDHPDVLSTRANMAYQVGRCGGSAEALRLYQELLADMVRVLGHDHPDTLAIRANIAGWTGECGDSAEALRLFKELLADQVRILGKDHPSTLNTRALVADWTGRCGNSADALRLDKELLPDRVRVLGKDHPATLTTRAYIAIWTAINGDSADALRLSKDVLPDMARVLGQDHPDTLSIRRLIARLADADSS